MGSENVINMPKSKFISLSSWQKRRVWCISKFLSNKQERNKKWIPWHLVEKFWLHFYRKVKHRMEGFYFQARWVIPRAFSKFNRVLSLCQTLIKFSTVPPKNTFHSETKRTFEIGQGLASASSKATLWP